jgi:hypothetical protein
MVTVNGNREVDPRTGFACFKQLWKPLLTTWKTKGKEFALLAKPYTNHFWHNRFCLAGFGIYTYLLS